MTAVGSRPGTDAGYGAPTSSQGLPVDHDPARTDLRTVIAIFRRRRWTVVATTVLALVIGITWILMSDTQYQAQTEILLEPDVPAENPEDVGRAAFLPQELQTQVRLVTSDAVLTRATDSLDVPRDAADDVTAQLLPETRVLQVIAPAGDPDRAADLARAVAQEYLALRRERATETLRANRDEAEEQVEEVRANVDRLDQAIAQTGEGDDDLESALHAERYSAIQTLNQAQARLAQLNASIDAQTGGGEVIEPATAPDSPVSPRPVQTGALALLLGLGLGVVAALIHDTVDDTLRDEDDVLTTAARPVLGRIPSFTAVGADAGGLALLHAPTSVEAEAYRDLRANLGFVAPELRTLTVTSPGEGEGKSTVASNLAVAASLADRDVVLVDGDLRRPTLHEPFEVPGAPGLSEVLVGEQDLDAALVGFESPALTLLPAGRLPPNPSELLTSPRLDELLAELAARYDLVVLDSPPSLAAPDAQELAARTDATLLVVQDGHTGRRGLRESAQRLSRAEAELAGVAVNRVDARELQQAHYYPRAASR